MIIGDKMAMVEITRVMPAIMFFAFSIFIIAPAYSAFGTLDRATINVSPSTKVGQAVQVSATIYTESNG
jgi:hypothetical protein